MKTDMKKIISLLLAFLFAVAVFAGCSESGTISDGSGKESLSGDSDSSENSGNSSESGEEAEELEKFDEYNLSLYMKPFWEGKVMYNETALFVGKGDKAPLLYKATEIVSVRSYDLKTEYKKGVDYNFDEKTNSLYLTSGTTIPYFEEDEYYPSVFINGRTFGCNLKDKPYLFFSEGKTISEKQIAITYRHNGENLIAAPEGSNGFKKLAEKLKKNESAKILFYGDSITFGCNSSGFVGIAPNADCWTKMVFDSLTAKYGATNAEYINTAVGGYSTDDGINNLEERVITHSPDAVVIAFGMNDYTLNSSQHILRIKTIVNAIREKLPETEICLVTPFLPNKEAAGAWAQQFTFAEEYYGLVDSYGENSGICIADVTKVHTEILEKKRYRDMTGNNVNHTNDFTARMYAQTVFKTIA